MADFWSGLSNFRFPDARIDKDRNAPLPTTLSGPEGVNGIADGKYNFNGDLLSGISAYAGPKTGRISSDRNYQQIPHRKQVFVPQVFLPTTDGHDQVRVSHAVDQGDLAIVLNPRQRPESLLLQRGHLHDRALVKQSATVPTLVNLATLNYILGGIQTVLRRVAANPNMANDIHFIDLNNANDLWLSLARDMVGEQMVDKVRIATTRGQDPEDVITECIKDIFKWRIVPFGICAGSEHQGGQHEVGLAPVQAAASHMTTLTVDGRNQDLVNLWFNNRVFAGDELCLHLRKVVGTMPSMYTLNHYYKETQSQKGFKDLKRFPENKHGLWQITPSTARTMYAEAMYHGDKQESMFSTAHLYYWRVARSFVEKPALTRRADDRFGELSTDGKVEDRFQRDVVVADDAALMRAHILEANFAPVFVDQTDAMGSTTVSSSISYTPSSISYTPTRYKESKAGNFTHSGDKVEKANEHKDPLFKKLPQFEKMMASFEGSAEKLHNLHEQRKTATTTNPKLLPNIQEQIEKEEERFVNYENDILEYLQEMSNKTDQDIQQVTVELTNLETQMNEVESNGQMNIYYKLKEELSSRREEFKSASDLKKMIDDKISSMKTFALAGQHLAEHRIDTAWQPVSSVIGRFGGAGGGASDSARRSAGAGAADEMEVVGRAGGSPVVVSTPAPAAVADVPEAGPRRAAGRGGDI